MHSHAVFFLRMRHKVAVGCCLLAATWIHGYIQLCRTTELCALQPPSHRSSSEGENIVTWFLYLVVSSVFSARIWSLLLSTWRSHSSCSFFFAVTATTPMTSHSHSRSSSHQCNKFANPSYVLCAIVEELFIVPQKHRYNSPLVSLPLPPSWFVCVGVVILMRVSVW